MRSVLLAVVLMVLPVGLLAQDVQLPDGWQVRPDRAGADLSAIRFQTMGSGYHITLGPSTILYNPADRAEGSYRVSATFTQTRAAQHPEAYGLLVGGRDLDGPNQDYLYFLVRQDGRFSIRHRGGSEVHTIQDWTESPAVAKIEGEGRATNALRVEAAPRSVRFFVNGTEVASFSDVAYLNTDGVFGLRVNHNLDLHVEGFGIER